jgi:hypothetical protein
MVNNMKKIYIIGCVAALSFAACKPNLKSSAPSAGTLDLSVYVAVGNSLTAGYADNSLYQAGQLNSYPKRLSEQFALVGGGSFVQPLLPSTGGYPSPEYVLAPTMSCTGSVSLGPVPSGDTEEAGNGTNIASQGPFNNVGVPGIRCVDFLLPGYGLLNPYAARFYKNPSTQTPLDEALRLKATFYSVWLGSNDVLGYATSGGAGRVAPAFPLPNDISPLPLFQNNYDSVMGALFKNGAKGVVINIPDVTAIPFFTTIPHNGLTLTASQAAGLNAAYAGTGITFVAGANNFIIQDASSPIGFRMMKDDELVLLTTPQDSLTCGGWGSLKPIPANYILDETEIASVRTYTENFNQVILTAATKYNLAYVDMNSYLKTLQTGILFNGVTYTAQYVNGGAFSLDGVHLTPRGYALVANKILATINQHYSSNIPMTDINKYGGIKFP